MFAKVIEEAQIKRNTDIADCKGRTYDIIDIKAPMSSEEKGAQAEIMKFGCTAN